MCLSVYKLSIIAVLHIMELKLIMYVSKCLYTLVYRRITYADEMRQFPKMAFQSRSYNFRPASSYRILLAP